MARRAVDVIVGCTLTAHAMHAKLTGTAHSCQLTSATLRHVQSRPAQPGGWAYDVVGAVGPVCPVSSLRHAPFHAAASVLLSPQHHLQVRCACAASQPPAVRASVRL